MERAIHDLHPSVAPNRRHTVTSLVLVALIFAAITPTLPWLEFSSSMENLNVATALEIRRTGNWLIPTLHGETRLAKPPLTAWATAAVISDSLTQSLSSEDYDVRTAAYTSLAWRVRLLALAAACAILVLTFHTARLLFDADVALLSLVIAGTSLLFVRFSRYAATDIPLAMFVTLTNLFLLMAVIRGRYWLGFVGGGIALALAVMSKGPVALIQTVLPVALFAVIIRRPVATRPLLMGIGAFLIVGLGWYVLVWLRRPDAAQIWYKELTGYQSDEQRGGRFYDYLQLIPYMTPWCVFFPLGVIVAALRRNHADKLLLTVLLVPLVIMSFFADRYARYMLPMLPAAAMLTAAAVAGHLRAAKWSWTDRLINAAHWIVIVGLGIGFPLGATGPIRELVRWDDTPWLAQTIGYQAAIFGFVFIALGIILQRRALAALVMVTVALLLGVQSLFMVGYSDSTQGRAEFRPLAELIWRGYPDAEIYNAHPRGRRPPPELAVYLNRELRWIDDPAKITPGIRPRVLMLFQDKGTSEPQAPPGWTRIASQKSGRDSWWVFSMPAL